MVWFHELYEYSSFSAKFLPKQSFLEKNCNNVGHISAKYESALIFEWLIIKNDWLVTPFNNR